MATFALAHMSCAGAWAWGKVPTLLRDAGYEVVAPDLSLYAGVTPADHARELVDAGGTGRPRASVVVAGHSYGGLVAPVAAELLGDAAAALVVIDGFVVDDGESAFDIHPQRCAARRAEAEARGDGMWTAGDPPAFAPEWYGRMKPMPISAFEAPVSLSGAAARLPSWFVHCVGEDFGGQAQRARARGWTVVEVQGPHALPLVHPARCVEVLIEAARSVRPTP
jgi:pimeloyl-ACP methyl ester carboxylesterase